ncbi:MAG: hypothetical protein D6737_04020 [Chloroflexi bacterium]|nr:MAG: hypothetical protein D6737_04020 [Chloroflexota bacterium]
MVTQALQAQSLHHDELMAKPNVIGVGVGYKESNGVMTDEIAVVTLVQQKKPLAALSAEEIIPRELDGMKTDVYEVGYIRALNEQRGRFRPVPGGVSIGHYKVTAGTLGVVVKDRTTGEKLLLSNNHVLANSNDAQAGDAILQPAALDGGQNPGDMVARLERFVRLRYVGEDAPAPTPVPVPTDPTPPPPTAPQGCDFAEVLVAFTNALLSLSGSQKTAVTQQKVSASSASAAAVSSATWPGYIGAQAVSNEVDCAVARPLDPNQFIHDIRHIGQITGTKPAALGMQVRKSGRTTDFTQGTVTLLNATVNVAYGPHTAQFRGQIITTVMSAGGDSGSLIVDANENKAVGLLFAGSESATIFNPIDWVMNALNITF